METMLHPVIAGFEIWGYAPRKRSIGLGFWCAHSVRIAGSRQAQELRRCWGCVALQRRPVPYNIHFCGLGRGRGGPT
eukprot:4674594-Lingulodinium_polyedra.AAC.1